jgi:hypothetical protein
VDDLSFLDDTPEDQVEAFRKFRAGVLIEGSSLGQYVAIIPAKSFAAFFPFATCYLPYEVQHLLSLDDASAKSLHLMKSRMGGFFEIKREDKTT